MEEVKEIMKEKVQERGLVEVEGPATRWHMEEKFNDIKPGDRAVN